MMGRVPEPYASMTNPLPDTAEVVTRGRAVFEESCASCHGREGLGNGEAGSELSPPPANLAMLIRMPMMRNDRYLVWAISEGGAPFGTQMPAFKDCHRPAKRKHRSSARENADPGRSGTALSPGRMSNQ